MPPFAAIERFFERLFERPSARLFRARLQPVQLQRRIERAMEAERLATADRTLVPNRFVVHLNPDDLDGFGDMTASLASELADGALVFARARHYTLVDRPRVTLFADPNVERTDIRVTARFADPIAGARAPRARSRVRMMRARASPSTATRWSSRSRDRLRPRRACGSSTGMVRSTSRSSTVRS
jgi:hypothetical protein